MMKRSGTVISREGNSVLDDHQCKVYAVLEYKCTTGFQVPVPVDARKMDY